MAFLLSVFQIGMHLIIILLVNIHLFIGILHSGEYIAVLLEEALSNGKAGVFGLFRLRPELSYSAADLFLLYSCRYYHELIAACAVYLAVIENSAYQ